MDSITVSEAAEKLESMQAELDALKLTNEEILQETKDSLVRMQGKIDALKSGKPMAWMYNRIGGLPQLTRVKPCDHVLNLIPLYLHSQPKPPLLTDDELRDMWNESDPFMQFLNFARAVEAKVRAQYESK